MKSIYRYYSFLLFHFSAYYLAWFSCIYLAGKNAGWYALIVVLVITTLQILVQVFIVKRYKGLALLLILFIFCGIVVDTLLLRLGILSFSANPWPNLMSPPWMASLWFSFCVLFYSVLQSFFTRYLLISILSLISFPVAYLMGVKMGAADFPYGNFSSIIVGIIWAILFPGLLKIYNHSELRG